MPELLRRLILSSADNVERIEFPSGDSVVNPGWDWVLSSMSTSPIFPSGISGWEIWTESNPGWKAEKDYKKRSSNPLELKPKETTFVLATPLPWRDRLKWQKKKASEGIWKDVLTIWADNLEQWLDISPAVALWLCRQINKISEGARDIEGFWEEWSTSTDPKMTTDIVLWGRTKDMERIHKWIRGEPDILALRADSPDEWFAFLYSSIMSLPEPEKSQALSRCILVDSMKELRTCLATFQNPLIIVAWAECWEWRGLAVEKGHRIFISTDSRLVDLHGTFYQLSRPYPNAIEESLKNIGFSKNKSQSITKNVGRSIPVLCRHLQRWWGVKRPVWANETTAWILLPLLFLWAWDENKKGDRDVITSLSKMTFEEYIAILRPLLSVDDSPIRSVGKIWMLKSPMDAWFMLAEYITDDHLKNFKSTIIPILTQIHPKYDLKEEDRWLASIYNKDNPYSEGLRVGVAESLVLIAVYGDRFPNITPTQFFVDDVVQQLFSSASKWENWSSMSDITPILAEASPEKFMKAVEAIIVWSPNVFQELLVDDNSSPLFGECRHSWLLWGLESIAWRWEYFSRVVKILFDLSKLDKGSRWNNRPINSLRDLFVIWIPQTYTTAWSRLKALDSLIQKDPKLVWDFTESFFGGGVMSESYRFKWRQSGGDRSWLDGEDNENYTEYVNGIIPRLIDLVSKKEVLVFALEDFNRLPQNMREKIITTLLSENVKTFSWGDQKKILNHVRNTLNWIHNYGDDNQKKQTRDLLKIYKKFEPKDLLERHWWLFSSTWPQLPQGAPKDFSDRGRVVKIAQEKAAREILNSVPLNKIIEFCTTIEHPGILWNALVKVANKKESISIIDAFIGYFKKYPLLDWLIRWFAVGGVEKYWPEWIDAQIKRIEFKWGYSNEIGALLYLGKPENADTWLSVTNRGEEFENIYWKYASGYSQNNKDEATIAVEKLLNVGRYNHAVQIAGDPEASIPTPLLQRLLKELVNKNNEKFQGDTMSTFYLGHIFKQIYLRNDLPLEEIARLEIPYAQIFRDIKTYTATPMAVHRLLQKDPFFFSELVSIIYKKDGGWKQQKYTDVQIQIAYAILNSWYLLPWLMPDGNINEEELANWIKEARKKCIETDHITGGDLQIGYLLAHSPSDPDWVWPQISVRNIIEDLNNDVVDKHISCEFQNKRGVTSRSPLEGWDQERTLVGIYQDMSEKIISLWPRTGLILRDIARSYEHEAKRHDTDANLRELL